MSLLVKPKKLKSAYSLQTDCTLDEPADSAIKINVFSPKNQKDLRVHPPSTSIKELDFQEEVASPKNSRSRKLIDVPVLCRKQNEITLLQGSNYSDPIQSQRLRTTNKSMMNGLESFTESIDFREMIIHNSSRGQETERMFYNSERVKNSIRTQTIRKEEIAVKKDKDEGTATASYRMGNLQKQSSFRPKMTTQHEDILKKANSSGKLMMKDYIYKVEASRRHSRQRMTESREKTSVIQAKKVHSPRIGYPSRSEMTTRKQAIKEKYKVSNAMMLDILKEDVQKELHRAQDALKKIGRGIREGRIEADNEQLLVLYNLRRNLKEQVNKTLEGVLLSMNIKQTDRMASGRMVEVQMAEQINFDELIKLSIRK